MADVLNDNLVPLVLADDTASSSALEAFIAAGSVTEPTEQCVSIRWAAVEQRRQRDYSRLFRDALQSSLLSGSYFALVFEDDASVDPLSHPGDASWISKEPSTSTIDALPEEWRLASFFDDSSLPPEIFCPVLFNARGRTRRFLPDEMLDAKPADPVPLAPPPDPADPTKDADEVAAETAAYEKAVEEARLAAELAKKMATKAAAQMPPTGLGSTGHIFELTPEAWILNAPIHCTEEDVMKLCNQHGLEALSATVRPSAGTAEDTCQVACRFANRAAADQAVSQLQGATLASSKTGQQQRIDLQLVEYCDGESRRLATDATTVLGMPLQYKARPALVATGRVSADLDDVQVQDLVKQRYGRHMPVHRLAVIVVSQEPSMEQTAWPGGPRVLSRAASQAT